MADLSKPRVVAVGGPTASGKTALSVALARAFDGEIINADSMQIYKNLDVGTAKPSAEEPAGDTALSFGLSVAGDPLQRGGLHRRR